MADAAKKLATYADLAAVNPNLVAEIIYGSLVTHPRPVPRHSLAQNSLGDEITGPFQKGKGGPGGWIFLTEPELHFGEDVVIPDLAGWKNERLTPFPETAFIETAPDWLCEILSESTEKYDRNAKRDIYAKAGVKYLWLLDPRIKLLEAFQLVAGRWLLINTVAGNDQVAVPPFDVVPFSLSSLWPPNEPEKNLE